jgi:type VI secretion system protein ImpF
MKKSAVFPSVFGRLFSDGGAYQGGGISLRVYREEVLRDLRWLLNTACHPAGSAIYAYPRVAASTLNFGMRDFVGVHASSTDPDEVADAVRECILRFEPRISPSTLTVRVVGGGAQRDDDYFSVEIIGDLWAHPASEPLKLMTSWDVVGGAWTFE